jgi:hypothetical protein
MIDDALSALLYPVVGLLWMLFLILGASIAAFFYVLIYNLRKS